VIGVLQRIQIIGILLLLITAAGCAAPSEKDAESPDTGIDTHIQRLSGVYQSSFAWYYRGNDPLLGPFEEVIELKSIGTFRSRISAPDVDPKPIIIRGYWKRISKTEIALSVGNVVINMMRFDQDDGSFVNADGYRYIRIGKFPGFGL
jgi:hypothetical protein